MTVLWSVDALCCQVIGGVDLLILAHEVLQHWSTGLLGVAGLTRPNVAKQPVVHPSTGRRSPWLEMSDLFGSDAIPQL